MAVTFACTKCGKSMQAREDFAGRKMRCPDCATILTIPAPPEPEAPLAQRVSPPAALNDHAVGEAAETIAEVITPPPARRAPAPGAAARTCATGDDPTFGQVATPWSEQDRERLGVKERPDRRGSWKPTLVALLLFLIAGGVAGYVYWPQIAVALHQVRNLPPSAGDPVDEEGMLVIDWTRFTEAQIVPLDAVLAAVFRPRAWLADTQRQVEKLPPYPHLSDLEWNLQQGFGLKLNQVEGITVFALPRQETPEDYFRHPKQPKHKMLPDVFVFVRTQEPYEAANLDRCWAMAPVSRSPRPQPRRSKVYPDISTVQLHAHLLLLGPTKSLPRLLDSKPESTPASILAAPLAQAKKHHLLLTAVKAGEPIRPIRPAGLAPAPERIEPRSLVLTVVEDKSLKTSLLLTFAGVFEAAQARVALGVQFDLLKKELVGTGASQEPPGSFASARIRPYGAQLFMEGSLPTELGVKLLVESALSAELLSGLGIVLPAMPRLQFAPPVERVVPPVPGKGKGKGGKGKQAKIVA